MGNICNIFMGNICNIFDKNNIIYSDDEIFFFLQSKSLYNKFV